MHVEPFVRNDFALRCVDVAVSEMHEMRDVRHTMHAMHH